MRLLSQKEIARVQSDDKLREISEGVKLSRRVDSLRKLAADEEQKFLKYRNESISAITEEIRALDDKRTSLVNEVGDLRKEKDDGMRMVEEKEARLREILDDVATQKIELSEKEDDILSRENILSKKEQEISDNLYTSDLHRKELERLVQSAAQDKQEANDLSVKTRGEYDLFLKEKDRAEKSLLSREQEIEKQKETLSLWEENNRKKEEELNAEKIRLIDMRETLERALKRINYGGK